MNGSLNESQGGSEKGRSSMKPLLECETCGRVLSSAYKLREHVMIHTGQKPHACTKCSQAFRTKPDLARHMRIHTGVRPYACRLCGQRFYRSDNLKGHMKTHKDMKVLSCFRCGKKYPTIEDLNIHYKSIHEKQDKAEHLAHLASLKNEEGGEEKTQSSEEMEEREVSQERISPVKSSPVLTRRRSSPAKDNRSITPHSVFCEECGQGFHQKGALAVHMKVVHPPKPRKTEVSSSSIIHVESISSDTAFICPTCGQVFTEIELLKDHISYYHSSKDGDELEVDMDENMNTRTANDLHVDINNDMKEWVVAVDSEEEGMDFEVVKPDQVTNDHVESQYYQQYHEDEEDDEDMELITCDTCKKVFPTKQDLYKHEVNEHSSVLPYKCTSCGRSFAKLDTLANHMRYHTGKSPHHCEFCGKTFTAASSLKEHLKIHSGMKPHHCHLCLKNFRQKCVLTRHMRNVHKYAPSPNASTETASPVLSPSQNVQMKIPIRVQTMMVKQPDQVMRKSGTPTTSSSSQAILPKAGVSLLTGLLVPDMQTGKSGPMSVVLVPVNRPMSNKTTEKIGGKTKYQNCPICRRLCMNESGLLDHIKNNHPNFKLVQTDSPPTSSDSPHQQPRHSSFCCAPCDAEFSSEELLMEHYTLVHPSAQSPSTTAENTQPIDTESGQLIFRCVWCRLDFKHKRDLIDHCDQVHPSTGESYLPISVSVSENKSLTQRKETSPTNESSNEAIDTSGSAGSDIESLGMSLRTVPQADALYLDGHKYRCALCAQGFKSPDILSHHMNQHRRSNPFFCNFCGETYPNTTELDDHLLSHRGTTDPHYLMLAAHREKSERQFTKSQGETISVEELSADNRNGLYGCNFCFNAFSNVRTLVLHLRHHITDRPFVCVSCGTAFSESEYLQEHVLKYHQEQPYVCDVCGRGFAYNRSLVRHRKGHRGYTAFKCEHCGETFISKEVRNEHVLKHERNMTYSCSLCGHGFAHASDVRRHVVVVHRDVDIDQFHAVMSRNRDVTSDMMKRARIERETERVSEVVKRTQMELEKEMEKASDVDMEVKGNQMGLEMERASEVDMEVKGNQMGLEKETERVSEGEGGMEGEGSNEGAPLDLSYNSNDDVIVVDEPSDDLMVMGAYYTNQYKDNSTEKGQGEKRQREEGEKREGEEGEKRQREKREGEEGKRGEKRQREEGEKSEREEEENEEGERGEKIQRKEGEKEEGERGEKRQREKVGRVVNPDLTDVQRKCRMVDLVDCRDCFEGFSDKNELKKHLMDNHRHSLYL